MSVTVLPLCRYIAVCEPLRYNSIMTPARLHLCCTLAWFSALLCIAVLFSYHMNAPLCRNTIQHVYCSNRAILRLACGPTPQSNIYGRCICIKHSYRHRMMLNIVPYSQISQQVFSMLH